MHDATYPMLVARGTNRVLPLSGRVVTAGSSPDCAIAISGSRVPPRAAHFLFVRGAYQVQPLGAGVTVSVNGEQVDSARSLEHGDEVVIAGNAFVYQARADENVASGQTPGATRTGGPLAELVATVVSLLRNRDRDVSAELVANVSRLLSCDAARLVGEDPVSGHRETVARFPATAGQDRFSSRAIDWAKQATRTVLVHDAEWQDGQESMSSLERNLVSSVLCVPLKRGDTTLGYLYLDRLRDGGPFTEEDRGFCDALAPLFSELLASMEESRRQRQTIARLQERSQGETGGIIHAGKAMTELLAQARKVARTSAPVLLLGQTGTGKELLARFVHENSSRAANAYRAVNCGAIPANLIESELFGHEKGAFTGASQRKIGLFEAADGGTVLLDEVGELPLEMQVKLLRVLQESEVTRVGGTNTVPVDIRIVAATNRDLAREVEEGRFRRDLYFRLNVVMLTIPPLCEREQDTVLLAEYFVGKYCAQFGFGSKTLSKEARGALVAHSWPGNVRELENVVQKAVLLSTGSRIEPTDLGLGKADSFETLKDARNEAEERVIRQALGRTQGNISLASKLLQIDRKWLMKKMEEFGVAANEFRE